MKKFLIGTFALCTINTAFVSCDAQPVSTIVSNSFPQPPSTAQGNFSGNYSNQGDPNRAGVFSMNLSQSGGSVQGTATYERGNGESSGMLSVTGSSNGGTANLSFYDQKGNVIANGVLSHNQSQYSFIQNSSSDWIPRDTVMDRY